MDNQRLFIWGTFGFLLWMTYQAWVQDHAPPPAEQGQTPAVQQTTPDANDVGLPALPSGAIDAPQVVDEAPALDGAAQTSTAAEEPTAPTIHVLTDVLDVEISTAGGTLQRARLLQYPVAKDQPNVLIELLTPGREELGLIQTGLNSAGDGPKANHSASFQSAAMQFDLGGADALVVPLTWTDGQGVTVEKTIRFTRGSYRIDVTHRLINDSNTDWRGADYAQILRRSRDTERTMFDVDSYSTDGPIIYDGEKSEKLDRDDLIEDGAFNIQATNGWVGAIQHHFLSAIVPPVDAQYVYNVSVRGDVSLASLISTPSVIVAPGGGCGKPEVNRRLRLAYDHFAAALLAVEFCLLVCKQLGRGHYLGHNPDQRGVLQTDRSQRTVDGEDARNSTAHEIIAGSLQG
jgi:YidC/Oxa1 family membrane protein insertase